MSGRRTYPTGVARRQVACVGYLKTPWYYYLILRPHPCPERKLLRGRNYKQRNCWTNTGSTSTSLNRLASKNSIRGYRTNAAKTSGKLWLLHTGLQASRLWTSHRRAQTMSSVNNRLQATDKIVLKCLDCSTCQGLYVIHRSYHAGRVYFEEPWRLPAKLTLVKLRHHICVTRDNVYEQN